MSKYVVIRAFFDLMDGNGSHRYDVGDTFPREGCQPEQYRIDSLLSDNNAHMTPFIELVPEDEPAKKKKK